MSEQLSGNSGQVSECEDCEQLDYAAIVGDAKRAERERIIKLLEELRSEYRATTSPDDCDVVNVSIALIKGEENDK